MSDFLFHMTDAEKVQIIKGRIHDYEMNVFVHTLNLADIESDLELMTEAKEREGAQTHVEMYQNQITSFQRKIERLTKMLDEFPAEPTADEKAGSVE